MNVAFPELATNHLVDISEMLACRDARQARQHEWLAQYQASLISLTIVAPGSVKDNSITRQAFNLAWQALHQVFVSNHWAIIAETIYLLPTGPEALIAINVPASELKQATVQLEQSNKVGRLWDIDVFNKEGLLSSRQQFGYPPRPCLICSKNAKICSRNRQHTQQDLLVAMQSIVNDVQELNEK